MVCLPAGYIFPINTSAFSVKCHVSREVLWNHWISGWPHFPFSLIQSHPKRYYLPGTALFRRIALPGTANVRESVYAVCSEIKQSSLFFQLALPVRASSAVAIASQKAAVAFQLLDGMSPWMNCSDLEVRQLATACQHGGDACLE